MTRQPVQSSHIRSIGHDADSETLEVEFKNGAVHHYHGVSAEVHAALLKAESIGTHFHRTVAKQYRSTKLPASI